MSDLGQLLKKARLDKGISLDQLEETTKIRKRYLEAIEEGDYKVLPGNFYVRAFIKSYAETVGLDPNEVLEHYGKAVPATEVEPAVEPIRRKRSSTRNTEKLSKWASNILMLSFILLILGIIYYFIGTSYSGNDPKKQVDPSDKITDKLPDKNAPSVQNTGDAGAGGQTDTGKPPEGSVTPPAVNLPEPVVTFARSVGNIDYYTVTNADKLNVKLVINGEECWLSISKIIPATADRKQEHQSIESKLYKKGDTRDWTSDQSVYLNIGFPPAAEITVNGVPIQLGTVKASKKVQIDLEKPM
ncbi:MAG: Xre family transcriptional regulator [Paenibacillus sp.]|uniref:helix-turn-helix domain-containing protein n=1 Tax=Paenibacillus sp. GCM10012303 TaxID=3317340 RepID=UPI0029EC74E8|nr:Xre family transcriptional regulator [Paenibacillus sp.]